MSFLKDLKEDLSMAVNELVDENISPKEAATEEAELMIEDDEFLNNLQIDNIDEIMDSMEMEAKAEEELAEEAVAEEAVAEEAEEYVDTLEAAEEEISIEDVDNMLGSFEDNDIIDTVDQAIEESSKAVPSDEVTEITKGTTIRGNIESDGSINVFGKVVGDIKCLGKASVTGTIVGKTEAAEVFANNAKIDGDIETDGCVKIGNGSVIIGSIKATSAVIGGAVKGDIDVQGPVIVDATAVVKGDIRSRSVQINNGAVIDGHCSQCYADIDYESLFDETFSK